MKRTFDLLVSLLALLILSPLFGLLALAVKLTSRGPIFYRGQRVGRNGVSFVMLKFRTMRDMPGTPITVAGDPRITPVGRLLRRFKLDELPQLINVARGEMSLVGPRPEVEEYVRLYTDAERRVLSVRPGLTSIASVRYRDEEAHLAGPGWHDRYVEILHDKLGEELQYLGRRTFWSDLRILLRTIAVVLG